jgi:hypothetical protein
MSNASSSPAPIAAKIDLVPLYTIIGRLNLPGAALAVIPPDATPSLALDALVRAGYGTAALRLVAHSLPKREAVWWACMCAEHTAPDPLPQAELAVAHSAQAWVRRPHDEAGFAAYALAERCGMRSAECWTAVAANWCGSTLSGPGLGVTAATLKSTGWGWLRRMSGPGEMPWQVSLTPRASQQHCIRPTWPVSRLSPALSPHSRP